MAADIQRRREEGKRKGGRGTETEGGCQEREKTHSAEQGVAEKHARTYRSDTEMDTEGGQEVGRSQSHSRNKKGHMTNIYLMHSDEEAIVDSVKDHKELYDKTNKYFKDKARKECLWERFATSQKLSVKVCNIWSKYQRTCYGKLTQSKSGQSPKEMTERQAWIQYKFHIRPKVLKSSAFKSSAQGASASAASAHDISRGSANTDSINIRMRSDTTIQPSVTSLSIVS